ncbi:hypothetical protein B0O99DRAFT_605409 [Bisporella sp. PMI_857]|nr:hypothetical protein B0O99DRAFT_605409 [Bisporella sp. PMI_857]
MMSSWLSQINGNDDDPHYYASDPEASLITTAQPTKFMLGTGARVLSSILSSCLETNEELILVTCFWAKSKSQQDVATLLRKLSEKAVSRRDGSKIRVRLCFSSISITQKLFQTSSLVGKIYSASAWVKMGLPTPEEIVGLDLIVKSVFVKPFSVMHPKFLIVDRKRAFLPSCNVSWEDWFEGCIDMKGDIVKKLFGFWIAFWARGLPALPELSQSLISYKPLLAGQSEHMAINTISFSPEIGTISAFLLPSPHHQNPKFQPFGSAAPPATPLNIFLLHALDTAKAGSSIYIQTPNLTSKPFISGIFHALRRGADIHIVTSRRLMILEQLVTAGTITEFEIWKLRRRYAKYMLRPDSLELGTPRPGALKIGYFKPENSNPGEPVKSHFKCVIVDDETTVLGSGNQDRASWYTSQELGIAFVSKEATISILECLTEALDGRVEYIR